MSFDYIHNHDKFNQKIDFSSFGTKSTTDIDAIHDFNGKLWMVLEAKTVGSDITLGQHILLQNLVKSLGATRPTFAVVAHHDVKASEAITGNNLSVSTVYSSGPRVAGNVTVYEYGDKEQPTYNEFLSHVMVLSDVHEKHFKQIELGGDITAILDSGVFDTEPPVAIYDVAIERPDMLQKFAELDFVDWPYFNLEMETWLISLGVNANNVGLFVEHVFYHWVAGTETLH
jgi:hypothetical protein